MASSFAVTGNNSFGVVGTGGYTAGSGTLTLATGQGANFPALGSGQFYRFTVVQAAYAYSPVITSSNMTIFRATSLTGDTFSGVLATEGTTDRNYVSGDTVDLRQTGGTLSDIQTAITNMQSPTTAALASNYVITTSNSWQNTGLSLSLPAAGTYIVFCTARINIAASGSDFWMMLRLIQSDTGLAVPYSDRVGYYTSVASSIQLDCNFHCVVTATSACTVTLYASRYAGAGIVWGASTVLGDGTSRSILTYLRVS